MADVAKITPQHPEWEQQTNETNKQHHFYQLFDKHGGTLEDFKREIKGRKKGEIFLGIKLKYEPYSDSTFSDLSACQDWFNRRDKHEKFENAFLIKQYERIDREKALEKYRLKEDTEYHGWIKLNAKVKEDESFIGGRLKDATQGLNNIQTNKNIDKEKPTDFNKHDINAGVAAEVKQEITTVENKEKQLKELREQMEQMTYD